MVGLGRGDGREWHRQGPAGPCGGVRASLAVAGQPLLGGASRGCPRGVTRRRRRSSTTRTLRRPSTPPSSTATAASSGCAPGTAASSLSVQDHATITGFLPGVSAPTVHAVGAEVSHFDLTRGGARGPPTGVMGHSCSSAAGRRIGILLRPARSSQSSRVLGPAASPLTFPAARGSLASRPWRVGPRVAARSGRQRPPRRHPELPRRPLLGDLGGRASTTGVHSSDSWPRAPGHLPRLLRRRPHRSTDFTLVPQTDRELLPLLRALPFGFLFPSTR